MEEYSKVSHEGRKIFFLTGLDCSFLHSDLLSGTKTMPKLRER
jgi:hypothetical protein